MENTPNDIFATPSDDSNSIPLEQELAAPHFDEEAIHNARPAVPLVPGQPRRLWPLALVLVCGSALLGAVMGIALWRYQTTPKQVSAPAANITPDVTSPGEPQISTSVAESEVQTAGATPGVAAKNTETVRATGARESTGVNEKPVTEPPSNDVENGEVRTTLQAALNEWIAATNARDITGQMGFYPETVNAFYLKRSVPREVVHAEKSRLLAHANLVNIKAASPDIQISRDGRTATMRFRKKYAIEGGDADQRGEVLQELRWQHTSDGWKIVSERDLRVIH